MAIQSHRIHSIHGHFGSAFAVNSPTPSTQASSFNKLPNVSVSSHGKASNLAVSGTRTGPVPLLQVTSFPCVRRPAPPPPSRQRRVVPTIRQEDPFADDPVIEIVRPLPRSVPSSSPPPSIASRTRIPPPAVDESLASFASHSETPPVVFPEPTVVPPGIQPVMLLSEFGYKEARGKLVAYMLLNRNGGRPARRRRTGCMAEQTYIPSALSRAVTVDSST